MEMTITVPPLPILDSDQTSVAWGRGNPRSEPLVPSTTNCDVGTCDRRQIRAHIATCRGRFRWTARDITEEGRARA
jgi:hypothetical protein